MPRYRKMTNQENMQDHSFSDHFRFTIDMRIDRDDAKDLVDQIELLIQDKLNRPSNVKLQVISHK